VSTESTGPLCVSNLAIQPGHTTRAENASADDLLSLALSRFAKVQLGHRVGPPTRNAADRRTAAAAPRPGRAAGACWVRRRFSRGFGRSHMVRLASPRPINRMARVQRPPIEAYIGAEIARLDEPLSTIVAVLPQALKRPSQNLGPTSRGVPLIYFVAWPRAPIVLSPSNASLGVHQIALGRDTRC
jgi:hypothetical protein